MTTKITRVAGTSRRVVDETRTYDPRSLTSTGYRVTLYADGHAAVEYRTRWQGHRTGTRYVSAAGMYDALADVLASMRDPIHGWIDPVPDHPDDPTRCRWDGWHQTRAGWVIQ